MPLYNHLVMSLKIIVGNFDNKVKNCQLNILIYCISLFQNYQLLSNGSSQIKFGLAIVLTQPCFCWHTLVIGASNLNTSKHNSTRARVLLTCILVSHVFKLSLDTK